MSDIKRNANENDKVYGYQAEWTELRLSSSVIKTSAEEVNTNA